MEVEAVDPAAWGVRVAVDFVAPLIHKQMDADFRGDACRRPNYPELSFDREWDAIAQAPWNAEPGRMIRVQCLASLCDCQRLPVEVLST